MKRLITMSSLSPCLSVCLCVCSSLPPSRYSILIYHILSSRKLCLTTGATETLGSANHGLKLIQKYWGRKASLPSTHLSLDTTLGAFYKTQTKAMCYPFFSFPSLETKSLICLHGVQCAFSVISAPFLCL